jgi:hypothetical protein
MMLRQDISWITIAGTVFVLAGSVVIAVAVFVKPRDAIRIAGQSGGTKPLPKEVYYATARRRQSYAPIQHG